MTNLSTAIEQFMTKDKKGNPRRPATIESYNHYLSKFLEHVGDIPVDEITEDTIEDFLDSRKRLPERYPNRVSRASGRPANLSEVTMQGIGKIIGALMKRIEAKYKTRHLELKGILPRTKPPEIRPPKTKDVEALIRATNGNLRDKAILLTLIDSGLRRRELCDVRRDDIDFDTLLIKVFGKTADVQHSPLSERAADAIKLYWSRSRWANDEWAFSTNRSNFRGTGRSGSAKLGTGAINALLRRLCKIASKTEGRKIDITPHDFRRYGAVEQVKNGTSAYELMRMYRWSDIETSMRYVRLDDESIRKKHAQNIAVLDLS